MANEIRRRVNFLSGVVDNNPLLIGGTTLTADELAALETIDATEHLPIVLDPLGAAGAPEIAWITAHTAGGGSATITRGREGTAARQHAQGIPWVHAPLVSDSVVTCTSATRPSGDGLPYWGMTIFETDTGALLTYYGTTVGWRPPWNTAWGALVADRLVTPGVISSSVTAEAVVRTTTAVSVPDNRRIHVSMHCSAISGGTANVGYTARIRRGTTTGGTELASAQFTGGPALTGIDIDVEVVDTPTANASLQYVLTVEATAATDVRAPWEWSVVDEGSDGVPAFA